MLKGLRMTVALLLAVVLTSAASASGGSARLVRQQVVASMVVTGEIQIDERGHVTSHRIDQVDKVPAGVVGLFADAVPQWQFEPVLVDGVARPARAKMRVRVVARKLESGDYAITFQDADFPEPDPVPGSYPLRKKLAMPKYPPNAARAGASAMVYVVIKVGVDGRAQDAAVEQVNLPFVAPEKAMAGYRKEFADAARRAALASEFHPPTVGEEAGKPSSVRIPYEFVAPNRKPVEVRYGKWATYVPGPYRPAPWRVDDRSSSPDLMANDGGPQPLDGPGGLRLRTALDQGS